MEETLQQRIRTLEAQQMALQTELATLYRQAGQDGQPPLAGLRIVDLSWAVFGPLSTQILSDMGAEVIKVERVDGGDIGRQTHSAYFTNRNKQSLAVDLQTPEGREVVLKLAETAHIFVQSFRPGVVERLREGRRGQHSLPVGPPPGGGEVRSGASRLAAEDRIVDAHRQH